MTSASVWYSRSGRRFHQPSGWQIKEKMIPGQPVTLQWDNGCFCYSFVFFKGERGGREGGRGGRKRRRGWGEEGGREGGRKGQHPCESRGNTCPPPWRTPDSASLSPEMLPVEGGGPAQPRPPTSSIPSPRSSLIGPHLHTSCGFERITKTTSSAQRSPSSHAATRIFPKGLLLRRQAQVKKKKKKGQESAGQPAPDPPLQPSGILLWPPCSKKCLFYPFHLELSPGDLRPLSLTSGHLPQITSPVLSFTSWIIDSVSSGC